MSPANRYTLLLTITYAIVCLLGNIENEWKQDIAPWLGEEPTGVSLETVRAIDAEHYPIDVYHIPANGELQQKIISTFRLRKSDSQNGGAVKYISDRGILPQYPEERSYLLETFEVQIPWLEVNKDGSMRLCPNDTNEYRDVSGSEIIAPPYPEYRQHKYIHAIRALVLAATSFLLPGVFCCIGWLWIQRKPICSKETATICLAIPAAVAFIGTFADFYLHGLHKNYAISSALFSTEFNLLCAAMLIALTGVVKAIWQKVRS